MSDLHNESIFITGGGSGLGLALVERYIEEGAQTVTVSPSARRVPLLSRTTSPSSSATSFGSHS